MNPQPKIQGHLEKWHQIYLSNMFSKSLMTLATQQNSKISSKPKAHLLAQMLRHRVGITFWKKHVPQQILLWSLTVSRRIDAFSPISVAFGVPPIVGTPSLTLLPTESFPFCGSKIKISNYQLIFSNLCKKIIHRLKKHLQTVAPCATCRDTPPLVKSVKPFGCPTDVLPEHCQALGDENSH